jgi:hypothetical protein
MNRRPALIERANAEWGSATAAARECWISHRMWCHYQAGTVKLPRPVQRLIQSRLELAALERRLMELANLTSREHVGLPDAPVSGLLVARSRERKRLSERRRRLSG